MMGKLREWWPQLEKVFGGTGGPDWNTSLLAPNAGEQRCADKVGKVKLT
jgi:hypothetical protein